MNPVRICFSIFGPHGPILEDGLARDLPHDIDACMREIDAHYDRLRRMLADAAASVTEFRCRLAVVRTTARGEHGEQYGEDSGSAASLRWALEVIDRLYLRHRFHLARFAAMEVA